MRSVWEELGIAPTADPREIRRAYASRLKGIDPDRDLASFQRLRQAYEGALASSRAKRGAGAASRPMRLARRGSDPMPQRMALRDTLSDAAEPALPPEAVVDETEKAAVIGAFHQALAAGAAMTAFAHLKTASARGLVSLAEEEQLFIELMALAMIDSDLSAVEFRDMAQHRNWHLASKGERVGEHGFRGDAWRRLAADERFRAVRTGGSAALRDMVATRVAAESWYEALLAARRRGLWASGRNEARVLLSRGKRALLRHHLVALLRAQIRPMRQLLAQYDLYRPWLEGRIDPPLAALLREFYGKRPRLSRELVMLRLAVAVARMAITLALGIIICVVGGIAILTIGPLLSGE